jgi:hypothetical protein
MVPGGGIGRQPAAEPDLIAVRVTEDGLADAVVVGLTLGGLVAPLGEVLGDRADQPMIAHATERPGGATRTRA